MALSKRLVRGPIYYGWYIVATAFVSQGISMGLHAYSYSVFLPPISRDLGWSLSELSGAQSLSTVVNGLLALFVGPFIDKRGGRQLMIIGGIIFGLGLMSTGLVQELWQFYFVRGVVVAIGNVAIGQLVVNVTVSNWFIKQRGRAIAFGVLGISVAGVLFPPLTQALIDGYGWRAAWFFLGLLPFLFVVPSAALFMLRRPEDVGLLPDGVRERETPAERSDRGAQHPRQARPKEYLWQRRQAMRTSSLWFVIAAFSTFGLGASSVSLHFFSYMISRGFSPELSVMGLSMLGGGGLLGKPLWGFIAERLPAKYSSALLLGFCSLGLIFIIVSDSLPTTLAAIFFFSIGGYSAGMVVQEVVWADYFGRLTIGAIRSVGLPITIVTGAGGPLFVGAMYDYFHSYQYAMIVLAAFYCLGAVLILLSRRPVHPDAIREAQLASPS